MAGAGPARGLRVERREGARRRLDREGGHAAVAVGREVIHLADGVEEPLAGVDGEERRVPHLGRETAGSESAGDGVERAHGYAAAAVARQCEAEANGPVLTARDAARTERRAIIRAVENAYLPADAAAEALESRIIAVKHAVVESVRWETAAPTAAGRTQTRPLACHARVRVTYVLGPR